LYIFDEIRSAVDSTSTEFNRLDRLTRGLSRRPGLRVKVREGSHGKRGTITYGVSRCLSAAGFQDVSLLASHIVSPNFRLPRRQSGFCRPAGEGSPPLSNGTCGQGATSISKVGESPFPDTCTRKMATWTFPPPLQSPSPT